jgi:hypothetical protein
MYLQEIKMLQEKSRVKTVFFTLRPQLFQGQMPDTNLAAGGREAKKKRQAAPIRQRLTSVLQDI